MGVGGWGLGVLSWGVGVFVDVFAEKKVKAWLA